MSFDKDFIWSMLELAKTMYLAEGDRRRAEEAYLLQMKYEDYLNSLRAKINAQG